MKVSTKAMIPTYQTGRNISANSVKKTARIKAVKKDNIAGEVFLDFITVKTNWFLTKVIAFSSKS